MEQDIKSKDRDVFKGKRCDVLLMTFYKKVHILYTVTLLLWCHLSTGMRQINPGCRELLWDFYIQTDNFQDNL